MIVTDAINLWTAYRARLVNLELVAHSTWGNQSTIAGMLANHLGENDLASLRKSHIEFYIGERLKTCKPVTVRGELNVLRQILNWAMDEGLIDAKPRMPSLSVANTETALPGDAAFAWVLRWLPRRHSLALEFMMLTGLAPHELERVQTGDFRDGEERPIFDPSKPGSSPVAFIESAPKLGIGQRLDFHVKQPSRRRLVPLSSRAIDIWQECCGRSDAFTGPVFPTVEAMGKAIQRLRSIPPDLEPPPPGANSITPKTMRKWFASKVAGQQPEHVLQRLMGHAPGSPITRRHYVRSSDAQGADAVAGLETPR